MNSDDARSRLPLHSNVVGGLWIIASAVCFTVSASLVKHLGGEYTPAIQVFYTQLLGLVLLTPLVLRNPARVLRPKRAWLMAARAALSSLTIGLVFFSYHTLPFADANALSFTRVFWVFPLAALLLKERLSLRVVSAAVVGFVGVMLIGGAGAGASMSGHWLAVGAGIIGAVSGALLSVLVKGLATDHDTVTLMAWSFMFGVLFTGPVALLDGLSWTPPLDLVLLCVMGAANVAQQACYIKGLEIGDAAAVAPFDYSRMVFATIVGAVVFNERPTPLAMAGAGIIVAAALYIMYVTNRPRATR